MDLFSPLALGDLALANRLVMAPLTRTRSGASGVPNDLNVEHYSQRASAGLIITEGTYPSAESRSYPGQPGIVTDEQEAGWKRVAAAVHAKGGTLVMQVMNGGRVSHTDITGTERIVAPSAIAIEGEVHVPEGKKPFPVPHDLTTDELAVVRAEFVEASRRAIRAGLDGVELHSANGYLLHQFLSPVSNQRTDGFGGSPENRIRFVVSVVEAVAEAIGAGRVGIRLSPSHNIQDVLETEDDDVRSTYRGLIEAIAPLGLAFVSVLHADPTGEFVQDLRTRFGGGFIVNSGFSHMTTREEATMLVEGDFADAVAVGRAIIANPDLVERWQGEHPENELDPSTLYGSTADGYTDYPTLAEVAREESAA
ncbi:alkene reductase [Subtercola boreus]|nr:alkene reductase [Subtercola boreus]RFA18215.1 alkene reductase [Subtercola boreus]RFA18607.1 alkene reductase [Subtercola boreus]